MVLFAVFQSDDKLPGDELLSFSARDIGKAYLKHYIILFVQRQ